MVGWGGDHFHYIAHLHQLEQLLHIRFAHSDAAGRDVVADGILVVGAVNAVALAAEPHPARTQWIGLSGRHDLVVRTVPGGVGDAADDLEDAGRAGGPGGAYGGGVDLHHAAVFHEG